MRIRWLLLLLVMLFSPLHAQMLSDPTPLQFADVKEEARFHRLTAELRCVQCQNQSLADSNAQIAHDMRRQVLELMREGKSDDQVKQFLVDRYGEFVLYRPMVESHTWLLWFGPILLLIIGGIVIWMIVRRRSSADIGIPNDEQEW